MGYARKALVHAIIRCRNCKWSTEKYLTAEADARRHVRRTGHTVYGDLGYFVTYPGVAERDKKQGK